MRNRVEAVFVVGPSATGKSGLVRNLTDQLVGKKTFVVNDSVSSDATFSHKIGWYQLEEISNCCLVVEDMITLSKENVGVVKHVLNFSAHHNGISPVYLITHSLVSNGMTEFMPYVNKLLFSACPGALSSVKKSLTYYGFTKKDADALLAEFSRSHERFAFFELLLPEKVFRKIERWAGDASASESGVADVVENFKSIRMRESAAKLLALSPDRGRAAAVFELVLPHLPSAALNAEDVSVLMRDKAKRLKRLKGPTRSQRISLIDYVQSLLDEKSAEPSVDLRCFHGFLSERMLIPKIFIKNRHYVKGRRPLRSSSSAPPARDATATDDSEETPTRN